eukprot:CAMPEP_0184541558 /NCGR_PEP_ID=MMETSP0199_2-20130426/1446_1 /TAXON_ID=1112570 /ORGANISM="Thraustochytrium sp., Strain LLF1b" /LENGTH=383 /DNA_ID=CAMNT_0026935287 /DNA_START=477 /DNA_END=1628 /DNA_ORIENTATION=+
MLSSATTTCQRNPQTSQALMDRRPLDKIKDKQTPAPPKRIWQEVNSFAQHSGMMQLEDLVINCLIGSGGFSDVVLAVNKQALRKQDLLGQPIEASDVVALKVVQKSPEKSATAEAIRAEHAVFKLLKHSPHPFLAKLVTFCESSTRTWIGLEYYPGGDMYALLSSEKTLSECDAQFYIAEISLALEHLHSMNVIYGDLKPENIMIGADGHIRVIDFGLSTMLNHTEHYCAQSNRLEVTTGSGTLSYTAPEILWRLPHRFESDWWALGVLAYEMVCGTLPWADENNEKLSFKICKEQLVLKPSLLRSPMSFALLAFINSLLVKEPHKRLGYNESKQVLEHPFFSNVNFELLLARQVQAPMLPSLSDALDVSNFDPQFTSYVPAY